MLITEHERLRAEIAELATRFGSDRSALLPIVQEIQRKQRQVSGFAMQVIADTLDIHPVEVYGVVSFYSFLSSEKRGRFVIRLCGTISCELAGKEAIARQLESDLGIRFGETTTDGMFSLEWVSCIGMCDQGPALLVNDQVHTEVTPHEVHEVITECRSTFGVYAVASDEESPS